MYTTRVFFLYIFPTDKKSKAKLEDDTLVFWKCFNKKVKWGIFGQKATNHKNSNEAKLLNSIKVEMERCVTFYWFLVLDYPSPLTFRLHIHPGYEQRGGDKCMRFDKSRRFNCKYPYSIAQFC